MPEQISLFSEPFQTPPLPDLLKEIRACTLCAEFLPLGPRPVLRASETARIMIVGQAPGTRVHATGVPAVMRNAVRITGTASAKALALCFWQSVQWQA